MDMAEARRKIAVRGGGVNFVAQFVQSGFGGFKPFRRGKGNQGGFVRSGDEVRFKFAHNYLSLIAGPEASPDFTGGVLIFNEPRVEVILPRSFLMRSMPRERTPRLVQ